MPGVNYRSKCGDTFDFYRISKINSKWTMGQDRTHDVKNENRITLCCGYSWKMSKSGLNERKGSMSGKSSQIKKIEGITNKQTNKAGMELNSFNLNTEHSRSRGRGRHSSVRRRTAWFTNRVPAQQRPHTHTHTQSLMKERKELYNSVTKTFFLFGQALM